MTHLDQGPSGPMYRRVDISPEDFFQALGRVRRSVQDEVERLIEWLDSTIDCDQDSAVDDEPCDGDADMEPSLGSFDLMSNQIKAWQTRTIPLVDAEIDACDDEPSLGSASAYASESQAKWAQGVEDDREGDGCADDREGDEEQHGGDEHDGSEPDACGEASLGWPEQVNQASLHGKQHFADFEQAVGARPPQHRTKIDGLTSATIGAAALLRRIERVSITLAEKAEPTL